MIKEFLLSNVHEGARPELRLEAENAFNHPVVGTPDSTVGAPCFGEIFYRAGSPRECQLAVKVSF
ncbi:MAG: hypothetical protein WB762_03220 [Candidatus Sulfotelmatobacter sp.]